MPLIIPRENLNKYLKAMVDDKTAVLPWDVLMHVILEKRRVFHTASENRVILDFSEDGRSMYFVVSQKFLFSVEYERRACSDRQGSFNVSMRWFASGDLASNAKRPSGFYLNYTCNNQTVNDAIDLCIEFLSHKLRAGIVMEVLLDCYAPRFDEIFGSKGEISSCRPPGLMSK